MKTRKKPRVDKVVFWYRTEPKINKDTGERFGTVRTTELNAEQGWYFHQVTRLVKELIEKEGSSRITMGDAGFYRYEFQPADGELFREFTAVGRSFKVLLPRTT